MRIISLILSLLLVTGTVQAQIGRGTYVSHPSWSPDGSQFAFITGTHVEIWDIPLNQFLYLLEGHTDNVLSVEWSPNGQMIATTSADKTAIIWNASDGTRQHILSGHQTSVSALAWSPDSSQLVTSDIEIQPNLYIWDSHSGELLSTHIGGSVVDMAFSPDGQNIAVSAALVVGIRDSVTLEYTAQSPNTRCCTNQMYTLAWSPDSALLVTGTANGLVTLWDADTAQIIQQFSANPHHQPDSRDVDNIALSWVRDVTFSPDGSTVLSVSGDGTIREWQVDTGILIQETSIGPLATARWSPYGARLLVLGDDPLDYQNFDASNLSANPRVIVPDPSPERLQRLTDLCAEASASAITACQADLLAVAAAMETE